MRISILLALLVGIVCYNEYVVYYLVLSQCDWPGQLDDSVHALILADTHLLGPFKGHWLDKLRREWQMNRAFQSAIEIHKPNVVFILGDIFDEGQWVDDVYFRSYVSRFRQLFSTSPNIPVYSAIGNHDVGFHYRLYPHGLKRVEEAFNKTGNKLITIRDTHFLLVNSMTMARDGCYFCDKAENDLLKIAARLRCSKENTKTACRGVTEKLPFHSRPILMQHFPTYRRSDAQCAEHDAAEIEVYRENWEVLSRDATNFIARHFNPSVAFSGHSHHYCRTNTTWTVEEYTLASFNWRNKNNPSFLLAEFAGDKYAVSKCDMPVETTVIAIYVVVAIGYLVYFATFLIGRFIRRLNRRDYTKMQ